MNEIAEIFRTIKILWKKGNRWLRFAIIVSMAWPILISLISAHSNSTFMTSAVGFALIIALIILLLVRFDPLWVPVISGIPDGKKTLHILTVWLGCGVLTVVFFSVVSPASHPKLVPLFILAVLLAALFLPAGSFFLKAGRFGWWVCVGITAIWLGSQVKNYVKSFMAANTPETKEELKKTRDVADPWLAKKVKDWREAPSPSPSPTPGADLMYYGDKSRWPTCAEVGLIDRSSVKVGYNETIRVHYHDCFYRVRDPAGSYCDFQPIRPVPFCLRYVYTGDRKGSLHCGIGDKEDMSGDTGSQTVEFVSDADVEFSVLSDK